jgi:hypothetical protein
MQISISHIKIKTPISVKTPRKGKTKRMMVNLIEIDKKMISQSQIQVEILKDDPMITDINPKDIN